VVASPRVVRAGPLPAGAPWWGAIGGGKGGAVARAPARFGAGAEPPSQTRLAAGHDPRRRRESPRSPELCPMNLPPRWVIRCSSASGYHYGRSDPPPGRSRLPSGGPPRPRVVSGWASPLA